VFELVAAHLLDSSEDFAPLGLRQRTGERGGLPQVSHSLAVFFDLPANLVNRAAQEIQPLVGVSRVDAALVPPLPDLVARLVDHRSTQLPCYRSVVRQASTDGATVRIAGRGGIDEPGRVKALGVTMRLADQRLDTMAAPIGITRSTQRLIEVRHRRGRDTLMATGIHDQREVARVDPSLEA